MVARHMELEHLSVGSSDRRRVVVSMPDSTVDKTFDNPLASADAGPRTIAAVSEDSGECRGVLGLGSGGELLLLLTHTARGSP